jgi:ABC-type nickel/cobalt efflux system permease component RcnA
VNARVSICLGARTTSLRVCPNALAVLIISVLDAAAHCTLAQIFGLDFLLWQKYIREQMPGLRLFRRPHHILARLSERPCRPHHLRTRCCRPQHSGPNYRARLSFMAEVYSGSKCPGCVCVGARTTSLRVCPNALAVLIISVLDAAAHSTLAQIIGLDFL